MIEKGIKKAFDSRQWTREEIKEFIKCKNNILEFCKYVKVIHPQLGLVPFKPYDFQKELLTLYTKKQFLIILASRQVGKTLCSTLYLLYYAIFNKNKTIAILANKERTAKSIMNDIRDMYKSLPDFLKPGVKTFNVLELVLENNSRIFAAATSKDALRGESVSILFLDEFAFVPANIQHDFYAANYPTVASTGGQIIIVSTPNGIGNLFYKLWVEAERGLNTFTPFKIYWHQVPGRDENWKKETIKNLGSKTLFDQEYDLKFVGIKNTLINKDKIELLIPEKPIYETEDGFKLYKYPDKKYIYVAGIDVAKGVGQDYSTIQILEIYGNKKLRQVAVFRNNELNVHQFYKVALEKLNYYFDPLVICENNDPGNVFLKYLFEEANYENIYFSNREPGIRPTMKTKATMTTHLRTYIENDYVEIYDYDTIMEIGSFVKKGSKVEADAGMTDDLIVALGWVCYMMEDLNYSFLYEEARNRMIHYESEQSEEEKIYRGFTKSLEKYDYEENYFNKQEYIAP